MNPQLSTSIDNLNTLNMKLTEMQRLVVHSLRTLEELAKATSAPVAPLADGYPHQTTSWPGAADPLIPSLVAPQPTPTPKLEDVNMHRAGDVYKDHVARLHDSLPPLPVVSSAQTATQLSELVSKINQTALDLKINRGPTPAVPAASTVYGPLDVNHPSFRMVAGQESIFQHFLDPAKNPNIATMEPKIPKFSDDLMRLSMSIYSKWPTGFYSNTANGSPQLLLNLPDFIVMLPSVINWTSEHYISKKPIEQATSLLFTPKDVVELCDQVSDYFKTLA